MLTDELRDIYQPVMGLEVHIQLLSNSKVFATEGFEYGAGANERVSPISLAHPGALPSLNRECIKNTIILGLATGCSINARPRFARKNYFYPDLPKGYQLSQDREPICQEGKLLLTLSDGSISEIRIERIHLEEDAGKSIHDQDDHYSLIDLNRAGVGLMELVTHPDFRSPEEVALFLSEIRVLVRYLGVSDADMEKGNLRCDANISVMRKTDSELGTRVEIKNLNSIRNAVKAIQYEVERQVALLESGGKIHQETRTFNPDSGSTAPMRDKETADDYRYFPEPDLLPLEIHEADIAALKERLPELPGEKLQRYTQVLGLPEGKAQVLIERRELAQYFESMLAHVNEVNTATNWLLGPVKSYLNEHGKEIEDFPLSPKTLMDLAMLAEAGKVTLQVAKTQLWEALLKAPQANPLALARELRLMMESKEDELGKAMEALMAQNPDEVDRYRKGKKQLAGFFVGLLMRQFKGKVDPKEVNGVVREKLDTDFTD